MTSLSQLAQLYRTAGISFLPIRVDGSKAPAIPQWRDLQKRFPRDAEIEKWLAEGHGLAAIGGRISGNLEVIDFDDPTVFKRWVILVRRHLRDDFLKRLIVVRTPRPGFHVVVRCVVEVGGSQKLAQCKIPNPAYNPKTKGSATELVKTLIETKAEGGYFLLPGSPLRCHESGRPYQLAQGSFKSIPTITAEERDILLSCARSLCRLVREEYSPSQKTKRAPGETLPGDDFNARAQWSELLDRYGFRQCARRGTALYWTRPGKREGVSASTNYHDSDLFYPFSTSLTMDTQRGYSKFAVYTFLEHNGDFHSAARELARQGYGKPQENPVAPINAPKTSPWSTARTAPDFINAEDAEIDWLDFPFLAPGSITEIFSPRGIGKTHVALAKAVSLASRGCRVLLLDRDNARREVRRRLKAWGALGVSTLKVMTRDEVPSLTDALTWATFPFLDYDLVIVDSLDSSAEGIGEKDSGKPSRAIAPLLDIAHRANGPAILILGNTIKSGQHSRGSGVVEDRADICYEVRDATGFVPTGDKWWEDLPAAGAEAWAERSTRRQKRDVFRLAFIPSKFRVGEEPNPFVLEINLGADQWNLRDVTEDVIRSGTESKGCLDREKAERRAAVLSALAGFVQTEAQRSEAVLVDKDAVPFLCERGFTRSEARNAIEQHDGQHWRIVVLKDQRGRPRILTPIGPVPGHKLETAAEIPQSKTLQQSITCKGGISAEPVNIDRRKSDSLKPVSAGDSSDTRLFPPSLSEHDEWTEKI